MKRLVRATRSENGNLMLVGVLSGLALLGAGCKSKEAQPGLLGPRPVVPSPYATPAAAVVPAQPAPVVLPTVAEPTVAEEVEAEAPDLVEAEAPKAPEAKAPAAPEVKSKIVTYKVKSGDSLWKIAWRHHVSVDELAEFNNLQASAMLPAGKTLNIPPGGRYDASRPLPKPPPVKKKPAPAAAPAGVAPVPARASETIPADGRYTVKKNDNLWLIARRFDLHVADIRAANALTTDRLEIGQVLVLPQPGVPAPPAVPGGLEAGMVVPPVPGLPPDATAPVVPPLPGAVEPPVAPPAPGAVVPPPAAPVVAPAPGDVAIPPAAGAPAPAAAAPPPNTLEHVVIQNETLDSIAEMYDTKAEDILKVNPTLKGTADLKPNMTIFVPYR